MCLTGLVGNIGLDDEMIEHRMTFRLSRQHQRHINGKGAVVGRLGIALIDDLFCHPVA